MNFLSEFTAIPALVIICYLCAEVYKSFTDKKYYRHVPVLCGTMGLVLGIVCYIFIPGFIPAENILVSAAIGIVSGFAATGINQMFKQVQLK